MKPESGKNKGFFPRAVDERQCRDAGMAFVLICLLIGFFTGNQNMFAVSIALLVAAMAFPAVYGPPAKIWFGVSAVLGTVMSRVVLTVIFFGLVTPVGLIRKMCGADPLQLGKWKKGPDSVFTVRDHTYEPAELEKPY